VGEPFNWVDRVSIELTTRMLTTLFDFPSEERSKLTYWSDVSTCGPNVGGMISEEEREAILMDCLEYFSRLWKERAEAPPKFDFISILAHDPATRDMEPMEFPGNLLLLIVGGNDTTRNSMSGSVLAWHENPDAFIIDRANPRNHISFGFGIHRCMGNRLASGLGLGMVHLIEHCDQPDGVKDDYLAYRHVTPALARACHHETLSHLRSASCAFAGSQSRHSPSPARLR
jgi:cytochrome P450